MDRISLKGDAFNLELGYPHSLLRDISQKSVMRNSFLQWQTFANRYGESQLYKSKVRNSR